MIPPAPLTHIIREHRDALLGRWRELWDYVQRQRPESNFPDPPYGDILDVLPFDPKRSPALPSTVREWFEQSPIFCSGAALCQLHISVAALLIREDVPERAGILRSLELSIENMMLTAGTQRWLDNLYRHSGAGGALHAERLAVIGHFAAGIAHEIGNPLASISAIVQVLERRLEDPFLTGQLAHVRGGVDRIARIVRELTDFSRPARTAVYPTDVNEVVLSAVTLARYDQRTGSISIMTDLQPGIPPVAVVPDQLLQVLINLLGNAFKFTRQGRIVLRVRVQRHPVDAGKELRFEVQDTGIGIADVQRARLFESFSQGDSSITRKYGGTGLGLSICRLLIDLMGGEIGVHTVYGKGSMFWFTLPLKTAEGVLPEADSVPPEEAASPHVSTATGLRVLVVEDNPVNQQVIAGFLRRHGITPRLVGDGVEALHVLTAERQHFDAVFMDCEMPNMDGYTATERIRQWEQAEQRPPVFICGVSAHVIREYRDRALAIGMDDFIAKPLQRTELERILAILKSQQVLPRARVP